RQRAIGALCPGAAGRHERRAHIGPRGDSAGRPGVISGRGGG
nr:hypothetical protein [Tanacetum cinerariifolium]